MRLIVLALSFLSIIHQATAGNGLLSLEKIWFSREYSPKMVAGFKYLKDGKSYCKIEDQEGYKVCKQYDVATGAEGKVLFSTQQILVDQKPIQFESFQFSADEQLVLFSNGFEAVYRHSGKSNVWVYNLNTKTLQKITDHKIMYATLNALGNRVAFVSDNNLFYYDLSKNKTVQVTKDGKKNAIINGAVDWVYEEEFTMSRGFEWSPDGQYLAYYRFDETQVPEFGMDIYGSLYPKRETWKYPKAGEPNSKVQVYIHSVGKSKSMLCNTQDLVSASNNNPFDHYLPRIQWMNNQALCVQKLNRLQNHLQILQFAFAQPDAKVIYSETNDKYVEVVDWTFSEGPLKAFFTSEKSGYKHLYALDAQNQVVALSSGSWEIDQVLGIDQVKQVVYFTSGKDNPSERQLYVLSIADKSIKALTTEKAWHNIRFSPGFNYFTDQYSTLQKPAITALKEANGNLVKILEDNTALSNKLADLSLGQVKFGHFTSVDSVELDYWQILPAQFDSTKRYPVLFFVYGGPGHQTVQNMWSGANYMWYQYLAQKGYMVITIDNRGSGGRGEAFKKMTYLNLGKYETMDYIAAAKYFGQQTYVDAKRIGIFGWSYGGFMASSCITKGADYFKAAVAVAPVTNWRYYDNIYTERYMRTPQVNAEGYDNNSPINHVAKIKGKYLIIHGTADDNVHFQNAAEMIKTMNDQNIPYDAEIYPNTNHGIGGGKTRWHLFNKITDFLLLNL
jgi:dipeptidyl-peptidase-4